MQWLYLNDSLWARIYWLQALDSVASPNSEKASLFFSVFTPPDSSIAFPSFQTPLPLPTAIPTRTCLSAPHLLNTFLSKNSPSTILSKIPYLFPMSKPFEKPLIFIIPKLLNTFPNFPFQSAWIFILFLNK